MPPDQTPGRRRPSYLNLERATPSLLRRCSCTISSLVSSIFSRLSRKPSTQSSSASPTDSRRKASSECYSISHTQTHLTDTPIIYEGAQFYVSIDSIQTASTPELPGTTYISRVSSSSSSSRFDSSFIDIEPGNAPQIGRISFSSDADPTVHFITPSKQIGNQASDASHHDILDAFAAIENLDSGSEYEGEINTRYDRSAPPKTRLAEAAREIFKSRPKYARCGSNDGACKSERMQYFWTKKGTRMDKTELRRRVEWIQEKEAARMSTQNWVTGFEKRRELEKHGSSELKSRK